MLKKKKETVTKLERNVNGHNIGGAINTNNVFIIINIGAYGLGKKENKLLKFVK